MEMKAIVGLLGEGMENLETVVMIWLEGACLHRPIKKPLLFHADRRFIMSAKAVGFC